VAPPAKRDVCPGGKREQAWQAKVEYGRTLRRREMQRSDPRVHTDHGCGQKDSGCQGSRGIDGGARMPQGTVGAMEAIKAEGTEAIVSEVRLIFGLPPAGEIPMRLEGVDSEGAWSPVALGVYFYLTREGPAFGRGRPE